MKYIIFLMLLYSGVLSAQKYDYNWFAGEYDQLPGPPGNFVLDFNTYPPSYVGLETNYFYANTQHSMSNIKGNFLYYSNGCSILEYDNTTSISIDSNLNTEDYLCSKPDFEAMNLQHGLLSIPFGEDKYYMFSSLTQFGFFNCHIKKFIYHLFDFSSSPGTVIQKNIVLKEGCFNTSLATKHANGRDWWILLPDTKEHKFYTWLLTPSGFWEQEVQTINSPVPVDYPTWTDFSPNGEKFAIKALENGTALYDFDRCSGKIGNYLFIPRPEVNSEYLSFSYNSNLLYIADSFNYKIIQYDLTSPDITASALTVGTDFGHFDSLYGYYTGIGTLQRGPDGKIYIYAGNTRFMHVIDFPNRQGTACRLRQRAVVFDSPTFAANAYYPNYRLGPIDGSGCDTLGIDNIPMAMYHYDREDTLSPLSVTFTDASYYEPTEWYWTFGDGDSSSEPNPAHIYASAGTYTVCLVAQNQYGSDTLCRDIVVSGTSGVLDLPVMANVMVMPNPVASELRVILPAIVPGTSPVFRLTDVLGREVLRSTLLQFAQTYPVAHLAQGIYFWDISWAGSVWASGKIIKN